MSQYPMPGGSSNPYQSPQMSAAPGAVSQQGGVPTFAKVMFIIDLVLSSLGAVGALISVVMSMAGVAQDQAVPVTPLTMVGNAMGWIAIALFLLADVWGLQAKPRAVSVGIAAFVLGLVTKGLGLLVLFLYMPADIQAELQENPEMKYFYYGGGICVVVLGVIYSFVWLAALLQFRSWLRRQGSPAAGPRTGMYPGGYGPPPGQMPPGQGYPGYPPGGPNFPQPPPSQQG